MGNRPAQPSSEIAVQNLFSEVISILESGKGNDADVSAIPSAPEDANQLFHHKTSFNLTQKLRQLRNLHNAVVGELRHKCDDLEQQVNAEKRLRLHAENLAQRHMLNADALQEEHSELKEKFSEVVDANREKRAATSLIETLTEQHLKNTTQFHSVMHFTLRRMRSSALAKALNLWWREIFHTAKVQKLNMALRKHKNKVKASEQVERLRSVLRTAVNRIKFCKVTKALYSWRQRMRQVAEFQTLKAGLRSRDTKIKALAERGRHIYKLERTRSVVETIIRRSKSIHLGRAIESWRDQTSRRHLLERKKDDKELQTLREMVPHLRDTIKDLRCRLEGGETYTPAAVGTDNRSMFPLHISSPLATSLSSFHLSPSSASSLLPASVSPINSPTATHPVVFESIPDPMQQKHDLMVYVGKGSTSHNESNKDKVANEGHEGLLSYQGVPGLNWDSARALDDWEGIELDSRGAIASLDLGEKLQNDQVEVKDFNLSNLGSVLSLSLSKLRLESNLKVVGDIKNFSGCRWLVSVNLRRTQVYGSITVFSGCPALERADLRETKVGGQPALPNCTFLKELFLSYTAVSGDICPSAACWISEKRSSTINPAVISLWACGPLRLSIKHPWHDHSPLEDIKCIDLSELNTMTGDVAEFARFGAHLEKLSLEDSGVGGDIRLLVGDLKHLLILNLTRTKVGGDVRTFRGTLPALQELEIASTEIQGDIAAFSSRHILKVLNVSNCSNIYGHLDAIRFCRSLETFCFTGTSLAGNIDEFKSTWPQLRVW